MGSSNVRTRVWREGVLEAENFPLEQVSDYLAQDACLVWADLCAPDPDQLAQLAEELSLDPHAIEDAMSEHERPKATRYATHLFLSAYALRHDDTNGVQVTHVSAFGLPHALVTVRLDDGFDIEQVVKRWDDNSDLMKFGRRALDHGLLDVIVDEYFEAIESLDDEIEGLEDLLFDDTSDSSKLVSRRAFEARQALLHVRRAILPMREVVNTVMRRATTDDPHGAELAPYFEDLYDHVLRAAEWSDSLRDTIGSIFETNMSLADTRMNMIMKKLTSWAAIIAVPTAVTGYFGQNVPYPGFGHASGFWLSISMIIVIALALYLLFKRKDWL